MVVSSPATPLASPCRAATRAPADASITSFLRRPPRDSSRNREVAVVATSNTTSSRSTSHCARWQPRPPGVLDRPATLAELASPAHQRPVASDAGLDPHRRHRGVGGRVHRPGRMRALVRVNPDDHDPRAPFPWVDDNTAVGMPTSTQRTWDHAPVERDRSRSTAGWRTLGERARRRQVIHERPRPTTCRTLRATAPTNQPSTYSRRFKAPLAFRRRRMRTSANKTVAR